MNITEATAVNNLLRWVTKIAREDSAPITDRQALSAAMLLADRAHKALVAGLAGGDVRDHWPMLSVPAKLENDEVVCGNCGATTFRYDENVPSVRLMDSNEGRCLTFWGNSREYDGDDNPGVVCANCDTPADLPSGVEINWR
jgi:hypothetical protein